MERRYTAACGAQSACSFGASLCGTRKASEEGTRRGCSLPMKPASPEAGALDREALPSRFLKTTFPRLNSGLSWRRGIHEHVYVEFLQSPFFCKAFPCPPPPSPHPPTLGSFSPAKLQGTILESFITGGDSPELTWALSSPGQWGREGMKRRDQEERPSPGCGTRRAPCEGAVGTVSTGVTDAEFINSF